MNAPPRATLLELSTLYIENEVLSRILERMHVAADFTKMTPADKVHVLTIMASFVLPVRAVRAADTAVLTDSMGFLQMLKSYPHLTPTGRQAIDNMVGKLDGAETISYVISLSARRSTAFLAAQLEKSC